MRTIGQERGIGGGDGAVGLDKRRFERRLGFGSECKLPTSDLATD